MEVKILTGFSGCGGSTIALTTLTNLFNQKGLKATLYGGMDLWDGVKCEYKTLHECRVFPSDVIIYHFMPIRENLGVKKQIISCHETTVFPIKELGLSYTNIHYVSKFQKDWHKLEGTVIPNPIIQYTPKKNKKKKVASIIGSIDRNKRTDLSIKRALADGNTDVRVYGVVTDLNYFRDSVMPLLSDRVTYRGVSKDMQKVYDETTQVYHSPELETFNLVKAECKFADVEYIGQEGNDTQAEYWDNDKIFESWINLIST